MRICVVGTGIAGTLLAWHLLRADPKTEVELLAAPGELPGEATAASGGLVRGYEPDPAACRLACESLAELRSDARLARWAEYREGASVYAHDGRETPQPVEQLALIDKHLTGSADLADAAALGRDHGITVPGYAYAVVERAAGHIRPARLREAVTRDVLDRGGSLVTGLAHRVLASPDGGVAVDCPDAERRYDLVVLATGWRTGALLRRSGLPADAPRVKLIQYDLYTVSGRRPPGFVDETSGLYGRPEGTDGMLLGVPSDSWGETAERLRVSPEQRARAEGHAATRLPGLGLVAHRRTVVAADAYSASGLLRLRPTGLSSLFTFTGGSGGAAKSALAAGRRAAGLLLGGPSHD
ncbi:NAD(P)/FAD-dependent oxidoreductase [Streptomyces glomeratus]|uniref:FAD dependent oxidoreductase domain-containing protein n=1 Tax=Streptomyces glomeratus TaxID=284452 RepID=A0ABP6L237_9ACTN|nr:FAD-dependent oxidoreductase [Streptomyces glomeratus]MCF1509562.1 FAD-binding oxidoreductase [Streptomyces glomeratus]